MVYAGIIISLLGGIMAAASLIVQFKADAKAAIEKLTPYQGIIGLILLGWGVWGLIQIIRVMSHGVLPVVGTIAVAIQIVVGFLLSFGLLSQLLLSKSEEAQQKGESIRAKLAPFQGILGLVLIGLTLWSIIQLL